MSLATDALDDLEGTDPSILNAINQDNNVVVSTSPSLEDLTTLNESLKFIITNSNIFSEYLSLKNEIAESGTASVSKAELIQQTFNDNLTTKINPKECSVRESKTNFDVLVKIMEDSIQALTGKMEDAWKKYKEDSVSVITTYSDYLGSNLQNIQSSCQSTLTNLNEQINFLNNSKDVIFDSNNGFVNLYKDAIYTINLGSLTTTTGFIPKLITALTAIETFYTDSQKRTLLGFIEKDAVTIEIILNDFKKVLEEVVPNLIVNVEEDIKIANEVTNIEDIVIAQQINMTLLKHIVVVDYVVTMTEQFSYLNIK